MDRVATAMGATEARSFSWCLLHCVGPAVPSGREGLCVRLRRHLAQEEAGGATEGAETTHLK